MLFRSPPRRLARKPRIPATALAFPPVPLSYPAPACGVPMASPSSPRLLSSLLADRLGALSARPFLRSGAPGRGTCPDAPQLLASVLHRVCSGGDFFAEMALARVSFRRAQAGDVSGHENALQLGGCPLQSEVSSRSPALRFFCCPACGIMTAVN